MAPPEAAPPPRFLPPPTSSKIAHTSLLQLLVNLHLLQLVLPRSVSIVKISKENLPYLVDVAICYYATHICHTEVDMSPPR